jgi:hypothetical protein
VETSDLLGIYTARCAGPRGGGALDAIFPAGRTTFFAYGRQALAEALRRGGVRRGDRVLLPGLICREVLASVAAVEATPRFYAVNEDLGTDESLLAAAAPEGARAVVAVDYFGFPQRLEPFREFCMDRGAVLIEDNAHGFLSADGDAPLGHRADFGVFSLRKTLALPNGAALVDTRAAASFAASTGATYDLSPAGAERRYRMKAAAKQVMALTGIRGARVLIASARLARLAATGRRVPTPGPEAETLMPGEAYSPRAARLLSHCDVAAERQRRRALYERCRAMLGGVPGVEPLAARLEASVVPQGYPFRFTGRDPAAFVRQWWRRGVPMVGWPDLPRAIQPAAPDHYSGLMLVPFLW